VVVPASRTPALSLTKSTSSASFSKAGVTINYTISATNTGNITLADVTFSDDNAVLLFCAPRTLAPGQSMTCVAVHTVTADDLVSRVIVNQAHASAQPIGAAGISVDSNTVVLGRTALPRTGGTVASTIVLSMELVGIGGLLVLLAGRRRRRAVH
jgi:hypothetical protein